jgi:hypothetical protein
MLTVPKSSRAFTIHDSASLVTLGFLCPAVYWYNCENTNCGQVASVKSRRHSDAAFLILMSESFSPRAILLH